MPLTPTTSAPRAPPSSWSASDLHRLLLSLHLSNALYPHFTSLLPPHRASCVRTLLLNLTLPTHPTAHAWPTARLARHVLTLHQGKPHTPLHHPPCTRRGRITLRVTPLSQSDAAAVIHRHHNPNVEVVLRGARPVWDVVLHFFHKWGGLPVRLLKARKEIRDLTMPAFDLVTPGSSAPSVVTLQFEVAHFQLDVTTMVEMLKERHTHSVRSSVGRRKRVCAPAAQQRGSVKRRKKVLGDYGCGAERQRLAERAAEAALAALNPVDGRIFLNGRVNPTKHREAEEISDLVASPRSEKFRGRGLESAKEDGIFASSEGKLGKDGKMNLEVSKSLLASPLPSEEKGKRDPLGSLELSGLFESPQVGKVIGEDVAKDCLSSLFSSPQNTRQGLDRSVLLFLPQKRPIEEHLELKQDDRGICEMPENGKTDEGEGEFKQIDTTNFESANHVLNLEETGEELSLEDDEESEGERAVMERLQNHLKRLDNGENVGAIQWACQEGSEKVSSEGLSCSAMIPEAFLKSGSAFDLGVLAKLPDSILAVDKVEGSCRIGTGLIEVNNALENASDGVELNGGDGWGSELRRVTPVEEGRSLSLTDIFRDV